MRADRLVATILILQSRKIVTAAHLASELEISVATARRDLEALSAAGMPIYPQRGRQGGWTLLGTSRTDLTGLTFFEMQSLFLLLGPAAEVSPDAKSALRKLVRALPATFRESAEFASAAVIVDESRWGESTVRPDALVDLLRTAVVARRRVDLTYRHRTGACSVRIEPWGLVHKARLWYLIAGTPTGRRTLRVDRIIEAVTTAEPFTLPEDFRMEAAWEEITEHLESGRQMIEADATLPSELVAPLTAALGARHVETVADVGDGRIRVRVTSNSISMLARQLAGWAPEVEVIAPVEVRAALAELGRQLAQRYSEGSHQT